MSDARSFQVPAPGKAAWLFVLGIGTVFPAAVIIAAVSFETDGGRWHPAAFGALAVALLIGLALSALMRRRQILLDAGTLVVKAAMYTRRTPLAAIDLDAARSVDLRERTELKARWKTNGYAIPGFQAGHFRLRDRSRAFLLVTDPRVLVLPVADGRMLLLSATRPAELLAALRQAAAR